MLYLTLRQYEYIVGVAEAGSLTKAAAALNVSQPSLSVAITRAEEHLGHRIFLRGRGTAIALTPDGHRLVAKARAMLALGAEIEQDGTTAPRWVLGCFTDIAPWYLAPALKRLRDHFPTMSFEGCEGRFTDLALGLGQGRMDAAISYDVGFDGHFNRCKLRDVQPVAFLPLDHPLARARDLSLSDLQNAPLILYDEDLSENFMRDLFARVHMTPDIRQKAGSLELMRSLAANGEGIGLSYSCPPGTVSYDGKRLATVPIVSKEAATEIALIWSSLPEDNAETMAILSALSEDAAERY